MNFDFIAAKISPYFRGNARISLLFPKNVRTTKLKLDYTIRAFRQYEEFKGKAVLSSIDLGCENGLAVIVTSDAEKENVFDTIEGAAISACRIDLKEMRYLTSCIHPTFTALNQCVIEAQYAYIASCIMEKCP